MCITFLYFLGLSEVFQTLYFIFFIRFAVFLVSERPTMPYTLTCLSDCAFIKCLCASNRWELLWRLCREFQSESELQAALQTEEEVVEEGWQEKEEEEVEQVEVVEEGLRKEEEEEEEEVN